MPKRRINVQGTEISILNVGDDDYISLTDMLQAKDGEFFISDWLRNRDTIEFLGIWEQINNSDFNYGEFAIIKSRAGLNNYKISVKEWSYKTNIRKRSGHSKYGNVWINRLGLAHKQPKKNRKYSRLRQYHPVGMSGRVRKPKRRIYKTRITPRRKPLSRCGHLQVKKVLKNEILTTHFTAKYYKSIHTLRHFVSPKQQIAQRFLATPPSPHKPF